MMAKNAKPVANDDEEAAEELLRKAKYGKDDVENSDEDEDEASETDESNDESEDASDEDGQTDDEAEDENSEDESTDDSDEEDSDFVKEFPNIKGNTLEEYAREMEKTLRLSNTEGKRLADELTKLKDSSSDD